MGMEQEDDEIDRDGEGAFGKLKTGKREGVLD